MRMYGQDLAPWSFPVFHDAAWPQPCRPRRTAQDAALLKAKQNLMEGPVSVELLFQAQLEAGRQVLQKRQSETVWWSFFPKKCRKMVKIDGRVEVWHWQQRHATPKGRIKTDVEVLFWDVWEVMSLCRWCPQDLNSWPATQDYIGVLET